MLYVISTEVKGCKYWVDGNDRLNGLVDNAKKFLTQVEAEELRNKLDFTFHTPITIEKVEYPSLKRL